MKSQTHSPAVLTSSRCAGSALTDGIAMNSVSSRCQVSSMAARLPKRTCPATWLLDMSVPGLCDVFEADRVREGAELLQALVLDLADALAGDVERPAHLVERAGVLAVEPVAQLEDAALAVRERPEDPLQRLCPHRHLGRLVGQRHVGVGEEVPELGLLVVADRLLERDGRLGAPHDLLDLVDREVEVEGDLERRRLATQLGAQLPLGAHDL